MRVLMPQIMAEKIAFSHFLHNCNLIFRRTIHYLKEYCLHQIYPRYIMCKCVVSSVNLTEKYVELLLLNALRKYVFQHKLFLWASNYTDTKIWKEMYP